MSDMLIIFAANHMRVVWQVGDFLSDSYYFAQLGVLCLKIYYFWFNKNSESSRILVLKMFSWFS